ncbi:MAG: hypothetical protein R8L53_08875 [Mariprofundales bacterium]
MSLNSILKELVEDVDGALGSAVVDVENGLVLGVHHSIPYFTQSYIDAVAAAAVDIFRGKTVTSVEKLLAAQRGETPRYHIKELQMTTDNTFHFMAFVPNKPNSLVVLITSRKTNLGMGWSGMRRSLPTLSPHCP